MEDFGVEALIAFAQENLIIIVVAIIAIILVISLVKTVLKWVIVAVVLIGILIYGFNYDATHLKAMTEKVLDYTKEEAIQLLIGDVNNAQYEQGSDGSFTIHGKNMKLEGKMGSNDVKLIVFSQTFNLKMDETLQKFVDQVKSK